MTSPHIHELEKIENSKILQFHAYKTLSELNEILYLESRDVIKQAEQEDPHLTRTLKFSK